MSDLQGIEIRVFDPDKITLESELGKGKFGKVFLATIHDSRLPEVAIKIFRKDLRRAEISEREKELAYEELLKLAVIDHENVVKLHGMVQNDLPWLVFEYMRDGNLLEFVTKNEYIREKTLVGFCRDICSGMAFLHSHHVLHKDLAARNILLDGRTAKIADLGLSSFLTQSDYGMYALNGKMFAFRHAAVECIVEQIFTFESDVWSFGVLMYEIFTGGMIPYGKENKEPEVRRFIVDHITPIHLLEPNCSSKIYSILKSILNPVLEDRPTFPQLHKKFQKLLNGKSAAAADFNHKSSDENISAAFTTFHQIKANGLSSSFSNLNSAPTTTQITPQQQPQPVMPLRDFLAVGLNNHKSTSTPDLLKAVGHHGPGSVSSVRAKLKPSAVTHHSSSNFLSVGMGYEPPMMLGKRHSIHSPMEPLHSSLKEDSPLNYLEELERDEPRRRANSGSRSVNPLLEGFVKDRFTRRKS